jgi:hypothetical protein
MIGTKICSRCNEPKPTRSFYKRGGKPRSECKTCSNKDKSSWVNRNRAKVQEQNRDWYKNNKEKKDKWYKENREAHPEKVEAHNLVAVAIQKRWLVPQPCEMCEETEVVAHHEDYDKPLEVNWYCRSCHAKVHHAKNTTVKN